MENSENLEIATEIIVNILFVLKKLQLLAMAVPSAYPLILGGAF